MSFFVFFLSFIIHTKDETVIILSVAINLLYSMIYEISANHWYLYDDQIFKWKHFVTLPVSG